MHEKKVALGSSMGEPNGPGTEHVHRGECTVSGGHRRLEGVHGHNGRGCGKRVPPSRQAPQVRSRDGAEETLHQSRQETSAAGRLGPEMDEYLKLIEDEDEDED